MDARRFIIENGFRRTSSAEGGSLTLERCKGRPVLSLSASGNTKRTITIDGTTYIVPEGYTLLESITFPSGAYLTTNIIPTTYDYEVTFKGSFGIIGSGTPLCAYGYMAASNTPRFYHATYNSKWLSSPNTSLPIGTADTDTHTFVTKIYEDSGTPKWQFNVDGTFLQDDQTMITTDWNTNTLPFYLGARNNNGTAGNFGLITAKQWSVKKAETLIALYIPAQNSSNVLGMYDFVTGAFFTNQGTGTFTAGDELPTPDDSLGVKGVGDNYDKYAVCMVLKHNTTGEIIYVPVDDYDATTYAAYTLKPFVRYEASNGKNMLVYKNYTSSVQMWAEYNRYKLECDTTTGGGFTWSVTINGAAKTGTVSWSAGDTLDSIVTQLNTGAVATYLVFSHESGEEFVRIRKGGSTNSAFTLSSITGTVTLTDLSKQMKIGSVLQDATIHREWQAQDAHTWISDFLAASNIQYARNGYNKRSKCGINFSRFKTWWSSNGSSAYVTENGTGIMNSTGFAACGSSSVAAEKALYDKYSGDYDSYLKGQMLQIDDTHTDGMEYKSRGNGKEQTDLLASVTTLDFDGTWIHAFPAAYQSTLISDADLGSCGMMTDHDIAVVMEDSNLAKINQGIEILGGVVLSNGNFCNSLSQYSGSSSFCYSGITGIADGVNKHNKYLVRPILSTSISYGHRLPVLHAGNCGVVDLGTLNWSMSVYQGKSKFMTSDLIGLVAEPASGSVTGSAYCSKYEVGNYAETYTAQKNKSFCVIQSVSSMHGQLWFIDLDFSDAASFKAAMSGVYLYYQRQTDAQWNAPVIQNVYLNAPLLKVGNYADEVDVIKGKVTRKIGIKVLDGTESWAEYARISQCFYIGLSDSKASQGTGIACSHYTPKTQGTDKGIYCGATNIGSVQCGAFYFTDTDFDDVDEWKAFVAAQYAAGTPLTVWYSLLTETEETITPISLRTKLNDNYAEAQATVPASAMAAKYMSGKATDLQLQDSGGSPLLDSNGLYLKVRQ